MLSKIELKLGKKTITLTSKQFEELKQDMRNLDKDHRYYWYDYQWPRWYHNYPQQISITGTTGLLTANLNQLELGDQKDPPAFNGTVLSAS